jgi:hypothetical protein
MQQFVRLFGLVCERSNDVGFLFYPPLEDRISRAEETRVLRARTSRPESSVSKMARRNDISAWRLPHTNVRS